MDDASPTIEELRLASSTGRIRWRAHALERLLERSIARKDVLSVMESGSIIESYPDDRPFPSVLLAASETVALHVVTALDRATGYAYVITAYSPDSAHFESDTMTRRRPS